VIALDYRGRGLSDYDRDWHNYDVAVYINDVHHLLVATGAHRVVVIGTSLGGIITMAMAAYFPTTLAAVVLNDVGPILNTAWVAKLLWYIGEDRPQPDLDTAAEQMHDLLPHLDNRDPEDWRWIAKNTFRRRDDGQLHFDWDVNLVKPLLRRRRIPDMWPWYRALRPIPTLALRGAESEVLSPQTLEAMLCEKPDLTALTVGGAGHVPLLDEPDAAAALDDFLDAH
jgi:pimeloyl-ACP methyl ester carboxylesterase